MPPPPPPLQIFELPFLEIELVSLAQIPHPSFMRMVTGEIGTISDTKSVPCTGEISAQAGTAVCTGEIGDGSLTAPLNSLAAATNHGQVLVSWEYGDSTSVDYFEVYVGLSADGPFYPYFSGRAKGDARSVTLINIPLGLTIWLRIRAVAKSGKRSDFAHVKRGVLSTPDTLLDVTGVVGSTIQVGASFSVFDRTINRPITYVCQENLTIA